MESKQLYQEVILDHNKKPRNWGKLADASHKAEGLNPLCGDHIWVSLKLDDERVENIAFEGEGCAICKASSSMMTTNVKGKTVVEAEQLVREFRDMATGKLDIGRRAQPPRQAHGFCRCARSAVAGEMRDPAVAHATRGPAFRVRCFHRG